MMLLIARRPGGRRQMLANVDPLRAALDLEDAPDEVLRGQEPPHAGVAGRAAVVAQEEVATGGNPATGERLGIAIRTCDVRLDERPAVDQDRPRTPGPSISGETGHTLDEDAARSRRLCSQRPAS